VCIWNNDFRAREKVCILLIHRLWVQVGLSVCRSLKNDLGTCMVTVKLIWAGHSSALSNLSITFKLNAARTDPCLAFSSGSIHTGRVCKLFDIIGRTLAPYLYNVGVPITWV
jgi:hypothetical protein